MDVVKRDGSKELFDAAKITRVVIAAGLDQSKASLLTEDVVNQLKNQPEVTSLQIRDLVSTRLRAVDQYAAGLYDWYQKTKPDKVA